MKKLIIIGAGSVGKFIAYNIAEFDGDYNIEGFLDDDSNKQNQVIAGHKVLGNLDTLKAYSGKGYAIAFGIAFPKIKRQILNQYSNLDFEFPNFIAKTSWLSKAVSIGKGCIIYPGVAINYESVLGDFVVINMNCSIGHNCTIRNYTSLAPGANLGGHTVLNEGVDFGIGASTKQNIVVGSNAVIGGQAMLVSHVENDAQIIGVPGKSSASS